LSDHIPKKTVTGFPYQVGEVVRIVPKDSPDLRGKGGCWAIITSIHEFSCDLKVWNGAVELVRAEYLISLEYTIAQCEQKQQLCERIWRLREKSPESSIMQILSSIVES
jgi:hypothetical protein